MSDLENNRLSFGYKDTDSKVEIDLYGLIFEIKNLDNIEELKKIDRNNINSVEEQIEKILGVGAVDKINEKRISDGYSKMDISIELNILGCIFETYAKSITNGFTSKITNTINDVNKDIENFGNRVDRRSYNNSRNRGYRNYRRY
ncbi:MAG: hypothetical protein HFJ45_01680 [Clostridia bacterium]|nr:hypothetical protein [Clostridia bacterium]